MSCFFTGLREEVCNLGNFSDQPDMNCTLRYQKPRSELPPQPRLNEILIAEEDTLPVG